MDVRIPEREKKPGVCYALSDDGIELPVIDITHAAFHVDVSEAQFESIAAASVKMIRRSSLLPLFVQQLIARRSRLMQGTLEAAGGYVSGMTTYLFKLGPSNLGSGYASKLDRSIASAVAPLATRIRLRDVAQALAEALIPMLQANPRAALQLLNVGGGTAIDSINTLLVIHKKDPSLLTKRVVCVQVLDVDRVAPRFGARALEALRAPGAPLEGVEAQLLHHVYNWCEPSTLRSLLSSFQGTEAIVAGSSEGGLFEYGRDVVIQANLSVLLEGAPEDLVFVGSSWRDTPTAKALKSANTIQLEERSLSALESLFDQAGWRMTLTGQDNPLHTVFVLHKKGKSSS